MGNAVPNSNRFPQRRDQNFPARGFRTRTGDAVCFNCGKRGHTYYYCRSKPDPRLPRYARGRQNNGFRQQPGQSSFSSNQGN